MVLAKSVMGVRVLAVVEHIGCLLLRIPNLGRTQFFSDQLGCQNGGLVADAVTQTYRRLVPPVLQTVQRRHRHRQKSPARGNPRREGTVVSAGM